MQTLHSADNRLSVQVPAQFKRETNLQESALIQASKAKEDIYFIVMEESKKDFVAGFAVNNYADAILSAMQKNLTDPQTLGERRQLTVQQMPAEQIVLTGAIDGIKITYLITLVEGRESFYQVLSWTLASRFDDRRELLDGIAKTFSER